MMELNFAWWLWVLLGLVLMAGEVLTPGGFYILFFGIAAVIVGLAKLMGLSSLTLPMEGLIFVVLSVAGVAFFRKPMLQRFQQLTPEAMVDTVVSETGTAAEEIAAGGAGKVELRGTSWSAENIGTEPIRKSQRCRVERVEGLTLYVRGLP